jgi:hypothetical protein
VAEFYSQEMNRRALMTTLFGSGLLNAISGRAQEVARGKGDECLKWLVARVQEAHSVKPGMTRAQLLAVFYPDGGLQRFLAERYVLRSCNYIKINVEFNSADAARSILPDNMITIKSVSTPYLEAPIMD